MFIMKESDEVAKENVTFQVSPIVQPKHASDELEEYQNERLLYPRID
jgi:hypothetical protein